ncbi:hypothetical protein FE257_000244 [Aspergillus nanangensis]|uniref:AB hydrolase-1 domain-containing protein n=1 Tax=Aspergillus nanangensis TaxID=2582783 RepID=A0AAD4CZ06_ASPNN|nr:hypothetical protein FE257_000244 [Aspergillus nanangensis]
MASLIWAKATTWFQWITLYLTPWRYHNISKTRLRLREVVRHLENESWTGLRKEFTPLIRLFLPESLLEKGWKSVCTAFGPLETVNDAVITNGWFVTTVKVPLKFQRAEFGMLLQLTPTGSLLTLRLLSKSALGLGNSWEIPDYADINHAHESEITLGKGELKVGGTLCLPNNTTTDETATVPCVVFLAGSGPCDRDSTIEENKPLKDLAWGLAHQGIASIRFDKVTHTHPNACRKRKNMTLTDEYVDHAVAAVLHARKHARIAPDRVFVLGHSLGAVVAPILAATVASIAGCIVMAGPAEPMYWLAVRQLSYIESLGGPESLYLSKHIDQARVRAELADSDDLSLSTPAKKLPFGIGPAYWLDYRRFDPIGTATGLKKPLVVMQGGRDYQVTVEHNYRRWHQTLHGKPNVRFFFYERLNHLFMPGSGPSTPLEYSVPANVDEEVVIDLAKWVLSASGC